MGMMYQSQHHPEELLDEVFFTNATAAQFDAIAMKTKRRGTQAYDGKGRVINVLNWYPVFVQRGELEQLKTPLADLRKAWRNANFHLPSS
jgi:hypothetical protein